MKQRYRLLGTFEEIKDLKYKTDLYGAYYIDLTDHEKIQLENKGYKLEEYTVSP